MSCAVGRQDCRPRRAGDAGRGAMLSAQIPELLGALSLVVIKQRVEHKRAPTFCFPIFCFISAKVGLTKKGSDFLFYIVFTL